MVFCFSSPPLRAGPGTLWVAAGGWGPVVRVPSGRQAFDEPGAVRLASVGRAVVEAVGAAGGWGPLVRVPSRRQAFDEPGAVRLASVAQAVVEAVGAALPELEAGRDEAEAAPVGR